MAFTYSTALTTNLSKVRHAIRDVTQNKGILPGGANFADEEINFEVTLTGSWQKAVPKLLRVAAIAWAARAAMMEEGDAHMEDTRSVSDKLTKQADEWEKQQMRQSAYTLVSWYEDAEQRLPFYETPTLAE